MDKKRRFTKSITVRILLGVFVLMMLGAGFYGFKLLVKVKGSISYLYNYTVNTRGSLPAVQYPDNAKGADEEVPRATKNTSPGVLSMSTRIQVNGVDVKTYQRPYDLTFPEEALTEMDQLEGIYTFRGNYYRNHQAFGYANLIEKKFDSDIWSFTTGKVLKSNGVDYWSGNGWTGQPLVVKWDAETKRIMNLYDAAKKKEGLVEVIYPGMDGYVHFLDMDTGEPTRDAINVGMTFKGTASLHPGGIPMLVMGSGDAQTGVYGECISPRIYIYSLLDGSKLHEFAMNDPIAPRVWHAFDSSAIFHVESDTIICPGENGVLYTLKLNTKYDKVKGALSISPSEEVRVVYSAARASEEFHVWGSECSGSVWENYLYLGDNGGIVNCINLNTMELVWTMDVGDDVNSSIIFDKEEDGKKYIYASTTLKYGKDNHNMGEANVYKLNAITGEIVWRKPYEVHSVAGLAGGFLATGIAGKGIVSNSVFYFVSKTPDIEGGYLVALDKKTGEETWRTDLGTDSWSSANIIYTANGDAYLLQGAYNNKLMLIDATTGQVADSIDVGGGIEATAAVFENKIVVGTRNEKIIGVTLR